MSDVKVGIVMGSKSDWEAVKNAQDTLEKFGVPCKSRVLSAHRTPAALFAHMKDMEANGCRVWIAAAGMSAHLAGVVAAHTTYPVLGVPMDSKLDGMDSLLSTVQMPRGIPVATFAIGRTGAVNAALFAVAILALEDADLAEKLANYRKDQAEKVLAEELD